MATARFEGSQLLINISDSINLAKHKYKAFYWGFAEGYMLRELISSTYEDVV